MQTFNFTIVVSGRQELTEDLAEALFAAGCEDGSPGSCDGVLTIDFYREAESLEVAIRTASRDVGNSGLTVDHVELEPENLSVAV